MGRATPDQVIAHVELLRAVDDLLSQAEIVREKREVLDRLLSCPAAPDTEGTRRANPAERGEAAHAH
jgi:hypothetical protein